MNVYTGGTFDLFHAGHVNLLKRCREISRRFDGGSVIVALNTDEFITKFKGKPPIIGFEDRKKVLESCIYVDKVIPNIGGQDSKKTIERLEKKGTKIDMVVIGSDWHGKDYLKQMQFTWEWLREKNIGLCYVTYTPGISTTEIKARL
jgi:glycerol-3-phosphate cytidylyltransferase